MGERDLDGLVRDYRVAFLRFLPQRSEAALTLGYDLGRRAVTDGVSLLDLVQVHHIVLGEELTERATADPAQVTQAACSFLLEVLSTFDMAHRSLLPAQPAASDD